MLRKILTRKMLTILFLGLASGIPLGIVITVLQAWMTTSGIDMKTVGLAVLVQMPYTWKFVWSPLMDRFVPPFLGRRRGWMLISQVLMLVSIVAMGQFDPAHAVGIILALATLVSFAGASHDIVIDAYRRDVLDESELGFGSAVAVNSYLIGYRYIGVVLGLFLGDFLPWSQVFAILGAFVLIGILGTLIAIEPKEAVHAPRSLREAVLNPFIDYLRRPGAVEILLFILLYKLGDNLASALLTPFYIKVGFSLTEISVYYKIISFWGTFIGGLVGGVLLTRYSIRSCLLAFGIFQGITPLSFALLVAHRAERARARVRGRRGNAEPRHGRVGVDGVHAASVQPEVQRNPVRPAHEFHGHPADDHPRQRRLHRRLAGLGAVLRAVRAARGAGPALDLLPRGEVGGGPAPGLSPRRYPRRRCLRRLDPSAPMPSASSVNVAGSGTSGAANVAEVTSARMTRRAVSDVLELLISSASG